MIVWELFCSNFRMMWHFHRKNVLKSGNRQKWWTSTKPNRVIKMMASLHKKATFWLFTTKFDEICPLFRLEFRWQTRPHQSLFSQSKQLLLVKQKKCLKEGMASTETPPPPVGAAPPPAPGPQGPPPGGPAPPGPARTPPAGGVPSPGPQPSPQGMMRPPAGNGPPPSRSPIPPHIPPQVWFLYLF